MTPSSWVAAWAGLVPPGAAVLEHRGRVPQPQDQLFHGDLRRALVESRVQSLHDPRGATHLSSSASSTSLIRPRASASGISTSSCSRQVCSLTGNPATR